MNKEEIMKILPHRDDMLLLDEAEVVDGKAHGKKTITERSFSSAVISPATPSFPA